MRLGVTLNPVSADTDVSGLEYVARDSARRAPGVAAARTHRIGAIAGRAGTTLLSAPSGPVFSAAGGYLRLSAGVPGYDPERAVSENGSQAEAGREADTRNGARVAIPVLSRPMSGQCKSSWVTGSRGDREDPRLPRCGRGKPEAATGGRFARLTPAGEQWSVGSPNDDAKAAWPRRRLAAAPACSSRQGHNRASWPVQVWSVAWPTGSAFRFRICRPTRCRGLRCPIEA